MARDGTDDSVERRVRFCRMTRAIPSAKLILFRRAVRAADGASLENWWAEMSLGFESLALRTAKAPETLCFRGFLVP